MFLHTRWTRGAFGWKDFYCSVKEQNKKNKGSFRERTLYVSFVTICNEMNTIWPPVSLNSIVLGVLIFSCTKRAIMPFWQPFLLDRAKVWRWVIFCVCEVRHARGKCLGKEGKQRSSAAENAPVGGHFSDLISLGKTGINSCFWSHKHLSSFMFKTWSKAHHLVGGCIRC